ncbi:MAG: DUF4129 domain-containing protein [Vicinamibacteria bacterium]
MILGVLLLAALPSLTVTDYKSRLEVIDAFVSSGDVDQVRALAHDLQGSEYVSGDGADLAVDAGMLKMLEDWRDGGATGPLHARLRAAIDTLSGHGVAVSASSDPALAAKLRAAWDRPLMNGETAVPAVRIRNVSGLVPEWVYALWNRFVDWIDSWIPKREKTQNAGGFGASEVAAAIAVGAVILLASLAYWAFRKRRSAPEIATVETASATDLDDDPTARQSEEWIAHAHALEREGRLREALRAWYHAALSALISRGLVAYAKGKTNWEYVGAVSPGAAFRAGLTNATLRFERSWYGGVAPTREMVAQHRAEVERCLAQIGRRQAS